MSPEDVWPAWDRSAKESVGSDWQMETELNFSFTFRWLEGRNS